MQWTGRWFIYLPDIALVAVPAPVMADSLLPAIEDGLVLALIIRTSDGKGILGPDDKGRQCPPAAIKAFCRVCNSEEDMQM